MQGHKRKASKGAQDGSEAVASLDVFSTSLGVEEENSLPRVNGALTPQMLSADRSLGKSPSPQSPPDLATLTAAMSTSSPPQRSHARSIGGSSGPRSHSLLRRTSLPPNFPGGVLNFVRFETDQIPRMVTFLKQLIADSASVNRVSEDEMKARVKVMATGGGAYRYYDMLREELGVPVQREDEMECLITGLSFITCIPTEVFWYSDQLVYEISHPPKEAAAGIAGSSASEPAANRKDLPRPSPDPPSYQVTFDDSGTPQFPCLLVNIGSGVSIVRVDEDGSYERVSGTSVGGGTLWGLLSLMTDANSFDGAREVGAGWAHANISPLGSQKCSPSRKRATIRLSTCLLVTYTAPTIPKSGSSRRRLRPLLARYSRRMAARMRPSGERISGKRTSAGVCCTPSRTILGRLRELSEARLRERMTDTGLADT